jgi:hypothetical protein
MVDGLTAAGVADTLRAIEAAEACACAPQELWPQ